jgi:hypothetical protein
MSVCSGVVCAVECSGVRALCVCVRALVGWSAVECSAVCGVEWSARLVCCVLCVVIHVVKENTFPTQLYCFLLLLLLIVGGRYSICLIC